MQRSTVSLPALLTVLVDPNAEVKPEARPLKALMVAIHFCQSLLPTRYWKSYPLYIRFVTRKSNWKIDRQMAIRQWAQAAVEKY